LTQVQGPIETQLGSQSQNSKNIIAILTKNASTLDISYSQGSLYVVYMASAAGLVRVIT